MAKITIKRELTREYLSTCLVYGRHSGSFTWLKRPESHFHSLSACNTWNSKHTGEPACIVDANGYQLISIDGMALKAHHAAFILLTGEKPIEVDHQNGVRSDNRFENLKSVTRSENTRNRKLRDDNPSGVPGVALRKETGRWRARINHDNKRVNLGNFATKEEAVKARVDAETKYGYHKNHGRLE